MEISDFESFNLGIIVVFIGKYINDRFQFLRINNIPDSVTGGLLFSFFFSLLFLLFDIRTTFTLQSRDLLILYFFSGIGLNARVRTLIAGGRPLLILVPVVVVYMIFQNLIGVALALAMDLHQVVGVLCGTASLVGGHGTVIAWVPVITESFAIPGALAIGTATATLGMTVSSLLGGPVARFFIERYQLQTNTGEKPDFGVHLSRENTDINYLSVLSAWLVLNICVALGLRLNVLLNEMGLTLPPFVACMFTGILLTNIVPVLFKDLPWPAGSTALGLISDLTLGVYLAMSLMGMQLWTLADVAGPVFFIFCGQLVLSLLFTYFVIFPLMGRDYEAAVICSGFSGVTLGATPTAIANMTAVTQRFGAAHKAFLVVPLVSAFFVDIANAFIIKLFLPG